MELYTKSEADRLVKYYKAVLVGLPLFEGSQLKVTDIIIQPFQSCLFMVTCVSDIEEDLKLKNSLTRVALHNKKILPSDYLKSRDKF